MIKHRSFGKLVLVVALCGLFATHSLSQTLTQPLTQTLTRVSGSVLENTRLPIGSHVTWVGRDIQQNGSALDIVAFRSSQSVQEVLGFYRLAWANNATGNAPGFVEHTVDNWSVISTILNQYLILLQIKAGLHYPTQGFFSTLEIKTAAAANLRPVDVPLPGGTRILSTTGANDGAKRGRTLIAENNLTVTQNFQFIRSRMRVDGWRLSAASGRVDQAVLMFDKAGEYCEISITTLNTGSSLLLINRVSDGS